MTYILIVILASFAGGLVQSIIGFGGGVIIMMIFPLVFSILDASTLNLFILLALDILLVLHNRRYIRFKLVIIPAISCIIGTHLAYTFFMQMELIYLKIAYSIFMICLAIYFIFIASRLQLKANLVSAIICSLLSGIGNGLFGIGGPPMAAYYLAATKDKNEYIAVTQTFFLMTSAYAVALRIISGAVTKDLVILFISGIIAVSFGEMAGSKIRSRISPTIMKNCVYFFLLCSGISSLISCF